jgi:hypothetical protein
MAQDKNQQRDEREMTDRPDQAVESGEQDETKRSRGRIIGEDGDSASGPAADKSANKPEKGTGQHWESGRQQARE